MIYNCIVIGGGASGLYCASRLVHSGLDNIAVIESNHKPGKKLLMTGGGRCNLTNACIKASDYCCDSSKRLDEILSAHDKDSTLDFFRDELGVICVEKNGLYYPSTFRAATVVDGLVNYLNDHKVDIITDTSADTLEFTEDIFVVNRRYKSRTVVLATGGISYPKTGSNGSGFDLIRAYIAPEDIAPMGPSLVPLKSSDKDIAKISGARTVCRIVLRDVSGRIQQTYRSEGEMLFTDYGVSGICVLDLSPYASSILEEGGMPVLDINLVSMELEELSCAVRHNIKHFPLRRVIDALSGILRDDLLNICLKRAGISRDKLCKDLSHSDIAGITDQMEHFIIRISGTLDLDHAQVTRGGVKLTALNRDLSLRNNNRLFVCGEAVNVCGKCGGYNLQFAWSSADAAAIGVTECLK
ncbi:hypothetical protein SAMN02910456_00280 [Ruminococcaceae bacterium YRB3002]|nr:hypothetical protein SAMN02910456_00280 [Ruminococcaceae bacterium YRB3002]